MQFFAEGANSRTALVVVCVFTQLVFSWLEMNASALTRREPPEANLLA